ncbi:unnamed protein product [Lactuca saligna]|uniref:Uncharacterized protein n=1 Tax=Lactuca saligna TaxID=75948 RepID=A0AA35YIT2_LACSI|nr:unnamed protein product [Lactuca saligna]
MDEGMPSIEITTSTFIETSTIPPSPTFPLPYLIPVITVSSTFTRVIQETITPRFSSQSTEYEKTIQEDEIDDENVVVSFAKLQFNSDDEDITCDLIKSAKQFKILNSKMNSILQFVVYTRSKHSVSGVKVEYLLKAQESRLKTLIENVDKCNDDHVAYQSHNFNCKISTL